ncbi:DUF3991 domain-containing protein, partial [Eubacterium aggregans]|uniref:DUF3991 domain-containing protein n=1 Tax=Eubacterium aggregans TaxID=81409 RepID=UPI003F2D8941
GNIKFVQWIEEAENRPSIKWKDAVLKLLECIGRSGEDVELNQDQQPMKATACETIKERPFVPPTCSDNLRRVFAYLIKTRHISASVVQDLVKEKLISEDDHHNCVFNCRDEKDEVRGAIFRSSQDYKIFKGMAAGSNRSYGFYVKSRSNEGLGGLEINNQNRLRVFESPIDMMSYFTLNDLVRPGYLSRTTENNLALGGLKPTTLLNHLQRHPEIETVLLAVDNDEAWRKFKNEMCAKIDVTLKDEGRRIKWIEQVPKNKDWNEDLQRKCKEMDQDFELCESE